MGLACADRSVENQIPMVVEKLSARRVLPGELGRKLQVAEVVAVEGLVDGEARLAE